MKTNADYIELLNDRPVKEKSWSRGKRGIAGSVVFHGHLDEVRPIRVIERMGPMIIGTQGVAIIDNVILRGQ